MPAKKQNHMIGVVAIKGLVGDQTIPLTNYTKIPILRWSCKKQENRCSAHTEKAT
jgi:hypothetical protein